MIPTDEELGTVCIILGDDSEFGISNSSLFIRSRIENPLGKIKVVDLGPPTMENFKRLIENMKRLECHIKED